MWKTLNTRTRSRDSKENVGSVASMVTKQLTVGKTKEVRSKPRRNNLMESVTIVE